MLTHTCYHVNRQNQTSKRIGLRSDGKEWRTHVYVDWHKSPTGCPWAERISCREGRKGVSLHPMHSERSKVAALLKMKWTGSPAGPLKPPPRMHSRLLGGTKPWSIPYPFGGRSLALMTTEIRQRHRNGKIKKAKYYLLKDQSTVLEAK